MFDRATGVAVIKNNKVLLGLRTDGQGWSLAGGKMEEGESVEQCAKRELFEEFNLTANKLEYIGQVSSQAIIRGVTCQVKPHIFICNEFSGEIKLRLEEMIEYKWFDLSEVKNIENIFPPSKEALKLISSLN